MQEQNETNLAEPPEGVDKGWFLFFITLLDQIYWAASTAVGAALGAVLSFSTEGVDFVMTAMFVLSDRMYQN